MPSHTKYIQRTLTRLLRSDVAKPSGPVFSAISNDGNVDEAKSTAGCDETPSQSEMIISRTLSPDKRATDDHVESSHVLDKDLDNQSSIVADRRGSSLPDQQSRHFTSPSEPKSVSSSLDAPLSDDLDHNKHEYRASEDDEVRPERASHRSRWSSEVDKAGNKIELGKISQTGGDHRVQDQQQRQLHLFGIADATNSDKALDGAYEKFGYAERAAVAHSGHTRIFDQGR